MASDDIESSALIVTTRSQCGGQRALSGRYQPCYQPVHPQQDKCIAVKLALVLLIVASLLVPSQCGKS